MIKKETTLIARGLAIVLIVLHNYFHMPFMGYTQENEMRFDLSRTRSFFESVFSLNDFIPELISFCGWVGVCVFVFLSGFGMNAKYGTESKLETFPLLWRNYKKLITLMLPTMLFFMLMNLHSGYLGGICSNVLTLTMLHNFVCNIISIAPGAFWYFGLTLQLYLIFYLLRSKDVKLYVWGGVICIIIQIMVYNVADGGMEVLSYFRHNFVGWFPVFAAGVLCSRSSFDLKKVGAFLSVALSLILLIMILLFNWNFYLWLFIPFISVMFFFLVANVVERQALIKPFVVFIGKYSAIIFASHPIAKKLDQFLCSGLDVFPRTLIYIVLIAVCAFIYRIIVDQIRKLVII